jgi:2'-5' RNA ligase
MRNLILSLADFINEAEKKKFSYGCLMAFIDYSDEIKEIHDAIDEDDVYVDEEDPTYGIEKESHCTVLYGLHEEVTLAEVKDKVKDIDHEEITVHNVSAFENEKFDVLKFDVKGKWLYKMNKAVAELPHTNKYEYHPHVTIAYLKSGKAKDYIKKFKDTEFKAKIEKFVFSTPDGKKRSFKL